MNDEHGKSLKPLGASAVAKTYAHPDGRVVLVYFCEGCGYHHNIPFKGSKQPLWEFNGKLDKPTLTPSVNVGPGHCHHFLTDGNIRYLPDCKHKLAGKTVPLEPVKPLTPDERKATT